MLELCFYFTNIWLTMLDNNVVMWLCLTMVDHGLVAAKITMVNHDMTTVTTAILVLTLRVAMQCCDGTLCRPYMYG